MFCYDFSTNVFHEGRVLLQTEILRILCFYQPLPTPVPSIVTFCSLTTLTLQFGRNYHIFVNIA